jgi:hypothetical protein
MGAYIGQIVNMICNDPQVKIQSQLDVDYYTPTMGTIAESEENHWYSKR